jgi:hypothetical protein
MVVGRTGKDVTKRVVCGVCWVFLREGEDISMRDWLGGGTREWKKMAGGIGYRDRGVNIHREERRHTSYRTLPFQHDLGFRTFCPCCIRPVVPGVCDDLRDGIAFRPCRDVVAGDEDAPKEHEGVMCARDMASFTVPDLGLRLAEEKQGGSAIGDSKKWSSEEGR